MSDMYEGACLFQPDRSPRCRSVADEDGYCPRHKFLIAELGQEGAEAFETETEEVDEDELDEDEEF